MDITGSRSLAGTEAEAVFRLPAVTVAEDAMIGDLENVRLPSGSYGVDGRIGWWRS